MVNISATRQRMLDRIHDALRHTLESDNVAAKVGQWQISSVSNHPLASRFQCNWKLFMGISLVLAFPITYLITSLKSKLAIRGKELGGKPPIMPYWVPFLGNFLPLLWDPCGFFSMVP